MTTIPPSATATPVELSDRVRAFLDEPNYATLATIGEDRTPHQAVIWYRLDPDERVMINSRSPRRWPAELQRDGRCSLAVTDIADPMRWVGLQAEVETIVDDVATARDDIVALAHRYADDGEETLARFRTQPRISFRLRIIGVHEHLED